MTEDERLDALVLRELGDGYPIADHCIASLAGQPKRRITAALARLEARGLVIRLWARRGR